MAAIEYIDFRLATIKMLRDWRDQEWKAEKANERIAEINNRMTSIRSTFGSVPVQGGGSSTEEKWAEWIDRKEIELRAARQAVDYKKEMLPCWIRLNKKERDILMIRFVDREEKGGIEKIMKKYHVSRSEAYKESNEALERLSALLWGR